MADFECGVENSARFWSAAALRRFSTAHQATQSGGGPPQSKTLARHSTTPSLMPVTEYLKMPYLVSMNSKRVVIVGGGAAGFFAAIAAAEPGANVTVLEKTSRFLEKVRISGGGRCNVTHAAFEPREFATRYPRGERALLGPLHKFSARDTVAWFESRGVKLKTEGDGRMFPVTDSSETIVNCLMDAAQKAGVRFRLNCTVESVVKLADGTFEIAVATKSDAPREKIVCNRLLLATGGCRAAAAGQLAVALGHTLEPPVPSLFTFQIESPWLRELAGVSSVAEVSVPGAKLRECGPVLVTHWGLSGPAVLRMSAWGARALHDLNYQFSLLVNWLPELNAEKILQEFQARRESAGAKLLVNVPLFPLTARLWEQLVLAAGVARDARCSALTRAQAQALVQQLTRTEFAVTGKSLNKDEFVTCGGVNLDEVNFKTMESKICPGLFFAGELLDIDGITGGFNFQAAWTTGFIAGHAMAA
ncbi:MAG TPA: NAD(P)/FAD-dependent oxidoreductase [Verrucomicrobiae bacterium]|nr:NAD(P)/FAD-dependent oxidoreductase [Verrucomicrobiae bacterium]